jgi:hypothetical protein
VIDLKKYVSERSKLRENSCIEWTLTPGSDGYGKAKIEGKTYRAHRVAWESVNGQIADGMVICHKCDNPMCVNVDHLFVGTPADNMKDKMGKGRYKGGPAFWANKDQRKGSMNFNAKLNESIAIEIKKLIAEGKESLSCIAKKFSVSGGLISQIKRGIVWNHVQLEVMK